MGRVWLVGHSPSTEDTLGASSAWDLGAVVMCLTATRG